MLEDIISRALHITKENEPQKIGQKIIRRRKTEVNKLA